ncbi:MAG: glycosyltransferase family 4 protein, partial [Dolichospermum sp.]
AQACGTPVIAYGAGGALETVRDIRTDADTGTGILFKMQTVGALVDAVEQFIDHCHLYNYEYIQKHAHQFSRQVFAERYLGFVNECREKRLYQK